MKIERISTHIWTLKSWMGIPVRVWVVVDDEGVTLVDSGMSMMGKGILRHIEQLNVGPLKRILLTHGHSDHVGSVKHILSRFDIPVYAHRIELPFIEGQLPYPRRKKPERILPKGLVQPLGEAEGRLQSVAGLTPHLTPGHAPGHVVYYHEQDQVLLAGDLVTSKHGKLNRPMPMFTADMAEALRSSSIIRELSPKRLEVCHGGPVLHPADHLHEYVRTTAARHSQDIPLK